MENETSGFFDTAIMDSDFKIIWSDKSLLFRRMSMASKNLRKHLENAEINVAVEYNFSSDGIKYKAYITPLKNDTYMCRIANPTAAEEMGVRKMRSTIENIDASVRNIASLCDAINSYVSNTPYINDEFHRCVRELKLSSSSLQSDCYNLLSFIESDSSSVFVPLEKYLLRTWDVMQFSTRKLQRTFKLHQDIVYPCVKVDYSKLELAFYNLVKIALIYSVGETPDIKFKTITTDSIEVTSSFKIRSDYSLDNCDLEFRVIKYIFKSMGGYFEVYEERGVLHTKGIARVEFSCDENDITEDMNIVYIGTPEILKKKKESDRYIRIYEYANKSKLRFASEVADLSDVEDSDVQFAEMFFSKVFLLNLDSQ